MISQRRTPSFHHDSLFPDKSSSGGEDGAGKEKEWLRLGIGCLKQEKQHVAETVGGLTLNLGQSNSPPLPPPTSSFGEMEKATASGCIFLKLTTSAAQPGSSSSSSPPLIPKNVISVTSPVERPQSGIWCMLQASKVQGREPLLPQIPKSYIRIKDGEMTVGSITVYLAAKLGLTNGSEVDMACRGQQVHPFLTVRHVRDHVWRRRAVDPAALPVHPNTATSDHLMVLNYHWRV